MRNTLAIALGLVIIIGGFLYFNNINKQKENKEGENHVEGSKEDKAADKKIVEKESTSSEKATVNPSYIGKVLAGKSAPFLEFNKTDYDKALTENKIILLDFYANWCPICRAEAPILHEGFNSLTSDKIIGFRVNFKDSDTDKDEEKLAKDFQILYQHSKVILKNGKEFSRSLDSWDKVTFDKEIAKALAN